MGTSAFDPLVYDDDKTKEPEKMLSIAQYRAINSIAVRCKLKKFSLIFHGLEQKRASSTLSKVVPIAYQTGGGPGCLTRMAAVRETRNKWSEHIDVT
jgi:hypothetical protein